MAGRLCIIPSRALRDKRLNNTDLKALNALGSYTDRNGWCYPSQQTIAEDIEMSRMSISRSIKRLCEYGYIISRQKFRKDGGKSSNEYKVLLDAEASEPPVTEVLQGCNKVVTGDVTTECYNNERPTLTKKDITNVISQKKEETLASQENEDGEFIEPSERVIPADQVVKMWNDLFSQRCMLTEGRSRKIAIRFREELKTEKAWYDYFCRILQGNDFIRGKTDKWRGATFDWALETRNIVKVLEGNYDKL